MITQGWSHTAHATWSEHAWGQQAQLFTLAMGKATCMLLSWGLRNDGDWAIICTRAVAVLTARYENVDSSIDQGHDSFCQ